MTEELFNLLNITSNKNIDFIYTSNKNVKNFVHYDKNKKTLSINIKDPNDKKEIINLKKEIKNVKKVLL